MKRIALGLLLAAGALYVLATVMTPQHVIWTYVAAFAEAAMVGAVADWFAVVALFRHPLGLPFPRTAVVPANKDRIGRGLAEFFRTHFLLRERMAARLRHVDAAAGIGGWLGSPDHAARTAGQLVPLVRSLLAALDQPAVHQRVTDLVRNALDDLDVADLSGRLLDAMVQGQRHQALFDLLLAQGARMLGDEAVQAAIGEAIAREVQALKRVGLDQVAARLVTRKLVIVVARTLLDMAEDPQHELRGRFESWVAQMAARLQDDEGLRQRVEAWRDELLEQPALTASVRQQWLRLMAWLQADLQQEDSWLRRRLARGLQVLGERMVTDAGLRDWINGQVLAVVPAWVERNRDAIAAGIEARIRDWDADEMSTELEHHIGRDLQFIRINGTLVGGLVGLTIHTVTQLW